MTFCRKMCKKLQSLCKNQIYVTKARQKKNLNWEKIETILCAVVGTARH
jgi:hypothetical protein